MVLRATLPSDVLARVRDKGSPGDTGIASGRYRDSEGLFQITGISPPGVPEDITANETGINRPTELYKSKLYKSIGPDHNETIAYHILGDDAQDALQSQEGELAGTVLVIPSSKESPPRLKSADQTGEVEVVPTNDAVFERVSGIVDTDYLAEMSVAIVGLGTGGSTVAIELAKCGVGTFYLYDHDILEAHNVSRHVCDISDIGRRKVDAIQDAIRGRNPNATIKTYPTNILEDRPAIREGVRDADCVLACTDTQRSRAVINEETVAFQTPTVYAGAFERAYGGNIVRYDPLASSDQPCHACIHGPPNQMEDTPQNPDGSFDYTAAEDAESSDFAAEPGLSVDVGFIALLQTRYALAILAQNSDRGAAEIPHDIIRWGNHARNEFDAPFQRDWIGIEPDEECPVCGPGGVAEQLRTSITGEPSPQKPQLDLDDAENLNVDF